MPNVKQKCNQVLKSHQKSTHSVCTQWTYANSSPDSPQVRVFHNDSKQLHHSSNLTL